MTKYHAIRTVKHGRVWDSKLELNFYERLRSSRAWDEFKLQCTFQHFIQVKPVTTFKRRMWRCDFRLYNDSPRCINIEVKGFLTRDFMLMFEMLEICNPIEFNRTYIATENPKVADKYIKLGERLIWLPDSDSKFLNPNNW